ncbi:MAG TPA: homoserine kinase [Chitinophagales bacterium]|nr:homoserine kinase [Chitinophagales bacterium]HRK26303.1 homoserine kinase [Chitinophagales bacterium]
MVTAFAPATVANLNCGFDVLGLAIDAPGDEVSVWFNETKGQVRIQQIEGDGGKLSYDPQKNTATAGIVTLLRHVNAKKGVDVIIRKNMPLGSGLGSSAASAVAGVVAANHLLGNPLTKRELVAFALDGEEVASGARHADNVAPSLLGGLTLIRSYDPLDIIELPFARNLNIVVVHPQVEILTKEARLILPQQIPLAVAINQTGNIAAFIAALYERDTALLSRSMTDLFAEPYRAKAIPYFAELKQTALANGAVAFGISGSGPSVFAIAPTQPATAKVANEVCKILQLHQINCTAYISKLNTRGAEILT